MPFQITAAEKKLILKRRLTAASLPALEKPFPKFKKSLSELAQTENVRILLNDKAIWKGIGNPSGLHNFLYTLIDEKFKKSGPTFHKRLNTLKKGDKVVVQRYKNITRDRGKWVDSEKYTVTPKTW